MGRTDLNGDGEYAFLYRELLFNIEHVEKVNEGELGHSRILIGTRGPKYGQHPTAAPATARAPRKASAGQKEMLLPIEGKGRAQKKATKPERATGRRKAG
jgi:hypothetical protein